MKGRMKDYKKDLIETTLTEEEYAKVISDLETEVVCLEDMKPKVTDEDGELLYLCPPIYSLKKIISDLNSVEASKFDTLFSRNLKIKFANVIKNLNYLENFKPK
jgi:hypothetical protein